MKSFAIFMTVAAFVLAGCSDDEVLRASVEREMRASLAAGDSSEKIERVLKEKKMPFNFDQFESRYETGIDPKERRMVQRVITIDIYIDAAKRLTKIEVRNTYTSF